MTPPGSSLRSEVRALPGAAWILFAETFVNRFGTLVLVFLVLYLTRLGWSPVRAGLAVSLYGVGGLVASQAGGHLADRIGRRRTIALSMFTSAAIVLALSRAHAVWAILLLTALMGLASESYRPAASGLLTDLTPAGRRVSAFAMYRLAINLGAATGPAVGGFLAERSFGWVFGVDAATSVVAGTVTLLALPEGRRSTREEEPPGGIVGALRADPAFVVFLLGGLASILVAFQAYSTLPLHVHALGYSSADYGVLMSVNGLLIVGTELGVVSVTRRFRPRPVMALGIFVAGLGFALLGASGAFPLMVGAVIVWTVGEMTFAPVSGAYIGDVAPEAMRGRYFGAWGLVHSLALVLAPAIGAAAFARNPAALWTGCVVVAAVGALLVLRGPSPERAPA